MLIYRRNLGIALSLAEMEVETEICNLGTDYDDFCGEGF